MGNDSLKINQKIDIVIEDGYYAGTYLSKISEIKDDSLRVIPPYLRGEIVPLRINQEIKVYFTGNNASYMFISRVLKREMEPVPLYTLDRKSTRLNSSHVRISYAVFCLKKKKKKKEVTQILN